MAGGVVIPSISLRDLTVANPAISNLTLLANIEIQVTFPTTVKRFLVRARTPCTLKLATTAGASTTEYLTIPAGCNLTQDSLASNTQFVFYINASRDTILEVLAWT